MSDIFDDDRIYEEYEEHDKEFYMYRVKLYNQHKAPPDDESTSQPIEDILECDRLIGEKVDGVNWTGGHIEEFVEGVGWCVCDDDADTVECEDGTPHEYDNSEPYESFDLTDDADALGSAGHGTDEYYEEGHS